MKILHYIKTFYIIFIKTKFIFSKPKKVDILLYDQGLKFNKLINNYFKKSKKAILFARFEELNIFIILDILIRFKFLNNHSLFQNYLIEYCKLTKPKLIISSTLWDERLLSLKKKLDFKTEIILVQLFPLKEEYFKHIKKKYKVDYIFHMNKISSQILMKYFFSKYIKIGSLFNNCFKIKKKKSKNILLISGFRKKFIVRQPTNEFQLNIKHEQKLVKILSKNIIKNSKFRILLKPFTNPEDYYKFMKVNKSIIIQNNNLNPYNLMDKYNLIITIIDSTMGHEALARGIKHIRVCRDDFYVSNSFFEKNDTIKFTKFLMKFYRMTTKKFFNLCYKNRIDFFPYDYNNFIFKNILTRIIKDK